MSDTSTTTKPVIVSGIQPSGALHLGNYFGAIKRHIEMHAQYESYYFIANYHALTSVRDAAALRGYSLEVARNYLALGFDPEKSSLFIQSDVPEVTELAWIFYNLVPVSRLELGVSYKDKVEQGLAPNAGLLNYPVLQAADILIYGATLVPVGADQRQHIEMTRDIAARFNAAYCPEDRPIFVMPDAHIQEEVAVVPGHDGRKMSKSYGNDIGIFDEGKVLKEKVMRIVTDSTPLAEPKDPDTDNVYALIKLFASAEERERIAAAYRAGGYGYGHAKKELLGMIDGYFAEARDRRRELEAKPDYVLDVLREGGKRARAKAQPLMEQVREACGILTSKN